MISLPPPRRHSAWTVLLIGWLAFATTGCAVLNKPKHDRTKNDNEFSCGESCPPSRPAR
ncbi:MAG: hypothetical protein Q8K78_19450 [Planctomycetaceae bacterium]|nr:hypothetical protein [Planctomycetaceae bacterium]